MKLRSNFKENLGYAFQNHSNSDTLFFVLSSPFINRLSNIVLHSPADYFLSTDKILAISEMATTSVGRLFAWNVIEEHWDLLFEKLVLYTYKSCHVKKGFNTSKKISTQVILCSPHSLNLVETFFFSVSGPIYIQDNVVVGLLEFLRSIVTQ